MPAVCRIGDADVPHCSGMVRLGGSINVFVNGIGVSRQTDVNTSHITSVVNTLKKHYKKIFNEYFKTGNIIIDKHKKFF